MRISDWSSDVCSSDLHEFVGQLLMMIKYLLAEILLVPKIGLLIRVMGATASERFVPITGRVEEIRGLTTRDAMTGWRGVERSPSHRNEVSSAQEAFPRVHVKGGVLEGSVALVARKSTR